MHDLADLRMIMPFTEDAAPDESSGNFAFVRKYDEELYRMILQAEGLAKTDVRNCLKGFRDLLAMFMQHAFEGHPDALREAEEGSEHELSLFGYLKAAQNHHELHIHVRDGFELKKLANTGSHWEEKKPENLPDYAEITDGFRLLQKFLVYYYRGNHPQDSRELAGMTYRPEYQPIGRMIVYGTEPVDSGRCEGQYLCFRTQDEKRRYYVVREYRADIRSVFKRRDEEVLNSLWNESIRSPQGIVKYERIDSTDDSPNPEDRKIFICYQLNGKPHRLSPQLLRSWSLQDKLNVMLLISEGVSFLHRKKIYHRNLQPSSLYVYRIGEEIGINLVNFEFSKVTASAQTVLQKACVNLSKDFFFNAPEVRGLVSMESYGSIDWEKVDIYSLGALFFYILENGDISMPLGRTDRILEQSTSGCPDEIREMIGKMLSNIIIFRPSVSDVLLTLRKYSG